MATVPEVFKLAFQHHHAGRLQEAEALYRQILQLQPAHPDALHLLGVIAQQLGRHQDAVDLIIRAIALNPKAAEFHNNLGEAYRAQGRLEEALAHYREALALKPTYAEPYCNLGMVLYAQGKREAAAGQFQYAISHKPDYAEAYNNLGAVLAGEGKWEEAIAQYHQAVALKPSYAEVYVNLGNALKEQGKQEDAVAQFRQAILYRPDYAEAYNNLGAVLAEEGRWEEAIAQYQRAVTLKPLYAEAHNNLGGALSGQGNLEGAAAQYRTALALKPDYAEARNNLGNVLQKEGKLEDAIAQYRQALALKPNYAEAHNNLASALQRCGRLQEAVMTYRSALAIKPDYAEAYGNLGAALTGQGKLDEAVACYRHALALKPTLAEAYGNLLFTLNYHPDKSGEEIFAEYLEYDTRYGLRHRRQWRAHSNSREAARRLKVGYVSSDFYTHSVRHFLEPLLAHHDKGAVEVYAYAEWVVEDALTERYKRYTDHWVPTRGLTDDSLAERIRADGIDVLVDLVGHTAKNRLSVFARKPAPVSVSWLGYGYTTGLTAIDYFLTDDACAPPGSEPSFAEIPWRLATPGFAYRPAEGMGDINLLPALTKGYVTFGTLSRSVRINHRTIRVWSALLKRVRGARLVIDSSNFREAAMQDALAEKFAAHGIGREQLEIGWHSPPWEVLRNMDIGLDCFPHNSGATLFETLYMGVPFVTLQGRPSVGRLGSSILEGVGHPEWITRAEDEYVEIAAALAADLEKLAALRAGLRVEMEASPLMDEPGFARKVEAAYREMWKRWCESPA